MASKEPSPSPPKPQLWKQLHRIASPQRHPYLQQLLDGPLRRPALTSSVTTKTTQLQDRQRLEDSTHILKQLSSTKSQLLQLPQSLLSASSEAMASMHQVSPPSPSIATMSPCTPLVSTKCCPNMRPVARSGKAAVEDVPSLLSMWPPQRPVRKGKTQGTLATPYQTSRCSPCRTRGPVLPAAPTAARKLKGCQRQRSHHTLRRPASAPPTAFQPPCRPFITKGSRLPGQHSCNEACRGHDGGEDQQALDTERRRSRHLCEELRLLRAQMLVSERRCSSSTPSLPAADEQSDVVRVRRDNLEALLRNVRGPRCGFALLPASSPTAVRVARRAFAEAELALFSLEYPMRAAV